MDRLHVNIPHRITGRYDLFRRRHIRFKHLADIFHFSVRGPVFHTIDRKRNGLIGSRGSLYINWIFFIICKFKIFTARLGNCRIRGRIYIGNDHRVITSLIHLQFCIQHGIIERSRYLTDTSAQTVYNLSVQIRTRQFISVLNRKRCDQIQYGALLTRVERNAVYMVTPCSDIRHPRRSGRFIGCCVCSEYILYLIQCLGIAFRLLHGHHQINGRVTVIPTALQVIQYRLF